MNNNLKFELHKHRDKIAIAAGAVVILAVLICLIVLFVTKESPLDLFTPKVDYANYYVTIEDNNFVLYDTAGTKMDQINHKKVIYPNHLGDEMIIYADGNFYKITAYERNATTANTSTCALKEELLLKYETKSIEEFVWNDGYFVVKRANGSLDVYNRETEKSIYLEELPAFEEFILVDNYIICTYEDSIMSINIETEEIKNIKVGAETYGLSVRDGKVFAFNRFGNGKNITSIFVLNPADLKIDALVTESSTNVFPVKSDSCYFVKGETKITLTEVGTDGKFSSITMNTKSGEKEYNDSNAVIVKDYLYTNKDGSIVVISLNKKLIQKTINITGDYFCPLYVEAK